MRVEGLVSVIIPCYNQAHFLQDALDSLEATTYPLLEVIVVDDGSTTSDSEEIFNSLCNVKIKTRTIVLHRQPNAGLSAARNAGIALSSGEYILPLDADDKLDPTFIEKCVWILTKYSQISIVYPSVRHFGVRNDTWDARVYNFRALLRDNFMIATSMYRFDVWKDVGGYDTSLSAYEDWDMWIRAGSMGHIGYWLPEYLFNYRKSAVSMLVSANKKRKQLIKEIRWKNKDIFDKQSGDPTSGKRREMSSVTRRSYEGLRWRLFVGYVNLSKKVPPALKAKVRYLIKPLIRTVFRYSETGYAQTLALEANHTDEFLNTYTYTRNNRYIANQVLNSNKCLNILMIVPWLEVGGADKVNLDLVENLPKFGDARVHIVTTLPSSHPWGHMFSRHTKNITHLGNWFTDLGELADYVLDYIKGNSIDIVFVSNSQLGYQLTGTIKRYYPDLPMVDLLHMEEPYEPFDYVRYSMRYDQFLSKRIVITDTLGEALVTRYGETRHRVRVIPNGIKVPDYYTLTGYNQKLTRRERTVGFIGRMVRQKQPVDFVYMVDRMSTNPFVHFVMLGEGSLKPAVVRAAESIKDKFISFIEPTTNGIDLLKDKLDVLVAPSLREGLPIVGLESLSVGVPVVAYNVPGWRDLIFDGVNGYLVPEGDVEELASKVNTLLADDTLRKSMSVKAFEIARDKFAIDVMISTYLEVFENLVNEKNM